MMRTATACMTAVVLLAAAGHAATWIVDPSDTTAFQTIQAAVDTVAEGDTVLVKPGTYTGDGNRDIDMPDGVNFVLKGDGGSSSVIIDGQDQNNHHCFNFYSLTRDGHDASMVIEGFTIRNFVVANNPHGPGAAVRLQFYESPTLRDLIIEDCQALATWGAGIWCNNNCAPTIEDVVIRRCNANNGAAIYCTVNSNPVFTNVTVEDCEVSVHGNVYISQSSNPQFINCRFEGNQSAADGGAVYVWRNCSPAFGYCHFIDNTAVTVGGAVNCDEDCVPNFQRCTFVYNTAAAGGAMNFETRSYPTIYNSIIAFTDQARGATVQCDGTSVPTVAYCCLSTNAGGDEVCGEGPGATNFFIDDPLFCNIETHDLTLASNSPCLAANNGWSQNIGAEVQGCTQSTVEEMSWGSLKALYR